MDRFSRTEFSDSSKKRDEDITEAARTLATIVEGWNQSRETAIALLKLEESIMWARKALR